MTNVMTFSKISYNKLPTLKEVVMEKGKCKVMKCGNSLVVALPKAWRERNGVQQGDYLEFDSSAEEEISFIKATNASAKKKAALDSLMAFIDRQPSIPWDDDSREALRATVGERYEA